MMRHPEDKIIVSVIVPVYNRSETLSRCVESILSQTFRAFELLLADDGSTDGTLKICSDYALIDSRIRVLTLPHRGVSAARNAGLAVAKGEYIAFVDSDDTIEPAFFERLLSLARSSGSLFSMCGWVETSPDGTERLPASTLEQQLFSVETALSGMLYVDNIGLFQLMCNKLIHRNLIDLPGGSVRFDEDVSMAEDALFLSKLYLSASFVSFAPWPLYRYNLSLSSATQRSYASDDSELTARRRMADLIRTKKKTLWPLACYRAAESTMRRMFFAMQNLDRPRARRIRAGSARYILPALICGAVPLLARLRLLAGLIAPVTSKKIAEKMKKRL